MTPSNKQLVFLGASSNIAIYAETASRQGIDIAGIIDEDYFGNTESICNVPIIGNEKTFFKSNYKDYNIFIGTNWSPHPTHARDVKKRLNFIKLIEQFNINPVNLIDPAAVVSKSAILGSGIYIGSNVVIEPNCLIDNFVQIFHNTNLSYGSTVGKNSTIQNNSLVVALIGKNSFIGMASKIFPYFSPGYLTIGNDVCVYPNLVVNKNIVDSELVKNNI
jgi:NDP-sugar pyrophosphorylase family protein